MRQRHCVSIIRWVMAVVQCSVYWHAQVVAAECWTAANGKEICSTDPTGLRATWWFFFALLLFAGAATGCFDADWWPWGAREDQDAQVASLENGWRHADKGLSVSLVHPLLEADKRHQEAIPSPPKPVYRYL